MNKHTSTASCADCRSVTKLQKTKKIAKKLLLFRSSVAVRLSISTKLCMQIEDFSMIFATDN